MAADDPWKLVQRIFEYGFFFNGLAQVCPPRICAPGPHDESRLAFFHLTACRGECPSVVSPGLSESEAGVSPREALHQHFCASHMRS